MKRIYHYLSLLVLAAVMTLLPAGCSGGDTERNVTYTFDDSAEGWTGDFTDLPIDDWESYHLQFQHTLLPGDLGGSGLMLRGSNGSDDLFMYARKELTGLKPDTTYRITFQVELATNVPAGLAGIGGAPGESVWVKVGASAAEPVPVSVIEGDTPYYRLNVDKGNQNNDGANAVRIGDIAKTSGDETDAYELKTLNNVDNPLEIATDGDGTLWVFVGTDSGFEGVTTLYYSSIMVDLQAE